MDQAWLAQRTLDAVADLPVRALLTLGPALDGHGLRPPANAYLAPFVPHGAVLPHASLVLTHPGWGTVNAALAAGVPLVCIPDGRDQPDNAARVVEAGAGVALPRDVSVEELRAAIASSLADESLGERAGAMQAALARRNGPATVANAVKSLETAASSRL
jgi:UDP:flavonoid glycosyltransferase YjiC (YdhE family)